MPDPISKRSRSFFASPRLRVIGAILSAAAVLFLLALIAGRNDEAPSIQEQAAREEAVVERVEALAPTEDSAPEDEVPHREDAAPSAAERPPGEPKDERGGRGRIYGSVAMPGGVPVPSDMRVTLHRFDSESLEVSYEDTLRETAAPGPDGAFDFKDLPLKSYALFATNAGHTVHSTATLSRARTERNLTLRVVPGGAITGRVLNETGEAVAGAHVFTAAWNMGGQTRNAPRSRALSSRVTTDAEGAFVMRNLRFGAPGEQGYRLAVKAEGYATYLSDYMLAGTQGVDLVLSFGGMIAGQLVHAETGEPAAEMVITLDSDLAMESLSATSDAEGWFFMTGVPPGSHQAQLLDKELVVVPETAQIEVVEGEQTADVLIQVAMGGRITGRVYDGDTGAGISGVKVRAAPSGFSLPQTPSAETDSQGHYEISGLDAGAYGVSHDKPQGYPRSIRSVTGGGRTVTAKLASEISGVDFELTKGIQIFGRVVDEEGHPLEQVMVNARASAGSVSDYVSTKRNGSFTVAGFSPQSEVRINVSKTGYTTESMDPEKGRVQIDEGDVEGVLIVMGTESSISGFVVDSLGNPKAQLQVYAQNTTPGGSGGMATTSADGAFIVDGLTAGEFTFQFSRSGRFIGRSGAPDPSEVTRVAKGEKITGLRLVYDEPEGLTIAGRVTNMQGGPVSGARVSSNNPTWQNVQTGPDGTYTLTGLEDSDYSVSVNSMQFAPPKSQRVAAGSRNVDFVVKPYAAIEGQVLSAGTGEPVTAFRVLAVKGVGRTTFRRNQFQSFQDAEGRFRLSRVQEGAAVVVVRAEGYSEARTEINGIVSGETVRNVVLRLESGAELSGTVVNRSGEPVASAQIFLGSAPYERRRNTEELARTNGEGQFRLTSLPMGEVTLSAYHRDYTQATVTLNVSRYSENRVEIVLLQGGVVEGYVTLNGVPQPDQNVHTMAQGSSKNARTDADGHYRMVGLPDGMNLIQASLRVNDSSRNQSRQAEVADDMTTTVDFDFAPGYSVIEGTVYEDETTPLRQEGYIFASINLGDGLTETMGAQVGPNGAYIFEEVPAGRVTLRVRAQGFPSKRVEFELGDRQTVHQDIYLFGGATIDCEISGGYVGGQTIAFALALRGEVDVPDLSLENFNMLSRSAVTQAQTVNGVPRLSGLEAGTYTVLVIILDQTAIMDSSDPLASALWQTSVVEVEKDQVVSVSFSF